MAWIHVARQTIPNTLVGLPPRFQDVTFGGIQQEELKSVTLDYLSQFGIVAEQGIAPLFLGAVRTYKSYAAAVIAKAVHERAHLATEFVSCASQLLTLEQSRFADSTRERIRRWSTVPFLVMDDFGVVNRESFPAQVLDAVATERFNNLLPTLWTGNFDLAAGREFAQLASLYSPLLSRRLEDGSVGFRVLT